MMAAGLIAIAPQAAHAASGSATFQTSGGLNQQWVVPTDVTSLKIAVKGAAGGAGGLEGGSGGRGASGTVTVPVTPGQTITVNLGKRGGDADSDINTGAGLGGTSAALGKGGNGGTGGNNAGAGGGGGGATEVLLDGDHVVTAGAGGGGGGTGGGLIGSQAAGDGGGADQDGDNGSASAAEGGHAGDAASEIGGTGDTTTTTGAGGAGGGGGGYQGGGQGAATTSGGGGGGGGGTSHVNSVLAELDGSWTSNVDGDGAVTITYESQFTTAVAIDDPNTVVTGQDKAYKVVVTAAGAGQTPTGSVELTAENQTNGTITVIGTKNLTGGEATFHQDGLLVGDYTLRATYTPDGDSDSLASTGQRDFSVVKGDTDTEIAGPGTPPNLGDSVDLGVTVTPVAPAKGVPSGQVKFYQDGNAIPGGTVTLDGSGQAVLSTTKLVVGTSDITAEYLGDTEFEVSEDLTSLENFVVNNGQVSVTLDAEHGTVIAGEKSKFVVDVASLNGSTTPTGSVQLYVDDRCSGRHSRSTRRGARSSSSSLPVTSNDGHHHIRAVYEGDSNYDEATSNWIDHFVNIGEAEVG
ncbi:Ig-like domain-containing protein [Aeromicrobium sp. UC242_57]|uniref:Ig-like domain-containing protein n=1 Tax=Aeromicrobium sp. UC242_57 TaxID=3374624 RepID=UPI00378F1C15